MLICPACMKTKIAWSITGDIYFPVKFQNSGQIAPLDEIIKLKEKYLFRVLLDESNSFGVLGSSGRGLTEHYGVPVRTENFCLSVGAYTHTRCKRVYIQNCTAIYDLWLRAAGWEVRSYNCCYGTCTGLRRRVLHRKCKSYRSPSMVHMWYWYIIILGFQVYLR